MKRLALSAALAALMAGPGCSAPDGGTLETAYQPRPAGTLTYSEHVAPILAEHCLGCHRADGAGPFDLSSYTAARDRASLIAHVTRTRFMPPWLALANDPPFVGARGLDDDEIGVLSQWAAEGAAEGDPAQAPPPPRFAPGWQLGEPDLVAELHETYRLPAGGPDVFRTFVLPDVVGETRHVRGIELRIEDKRIVHHVEVKIDPSEESLAYDRNEPGPGAEGMIDVGRADFPDGYWLGWTPGQAPALLDEGWSWPLEAGTDLVLLYHMLPSGKPERIRPKVGLYFAAAPARERPILVRLVREDQDIPAGAADHMVEDAFTLPIDVRVMSVHPHAHYLGKSLRGWAVLPDGREQGLLHIPEWDFNWQEEYRYAEPIALPAGTTLHLRLRYDNSEANPRNPNHPPKRVFYGPRSSDEMGELKIQVLPARPEEREILVREVARADVAKGIARFRARVSRDPADVEAHRWLGTLLAAQGDTAGALGHLEQAVRLAPGSARIQHDLGSLLAEQGDFTRARRHLGIALGIEPGRANTMKNLAGLLVAMDKPRQAIAQYQQALAAAPEDVEILNNLGSLLAREGDLVGAIRLYDEALRIQPAAADARENRARARALLDARAP